MRTGTFRALKFLIAVWLLLPSSVTVSAQQSDTVQVSGAVVAAPISISIPDFPVVFGAINSLGSPQTSTDSALGYLADDVSGSLWFSYSRVSITMTSPDPFTATACISAHNNLPASGLHLFDTIPTDASAANAAFGKPNIHVETCPKSLQWAALGPGQHTRPLYVGIWLRHADPTIPFTATITFSVSN